MPTERKRVKKEEVIEEVEVLEEVVEKPKKTRSSKSKKHEEEDVQEEEVVEKKPRKKTTAPAKEAEVPEEAPAIKKRSTKVTRADFDNVIRKIIDEFNLDRDEVVALVGDDLSASSEFSSKKKHSRRTSKKAPNGIRKPASAYILFTTDMRPKVKLENPDLNFSQITIKNNK